MELIPKTYEPTFAQRVYSFGASPLFLIGAILYTAGAGIGILLNLNAFMPIASFISFGIAALPIIGMWLLYTACKNQDGDKVVNALKIFRASVIIALVVIGLAGALVLLFGGIGAIISASIEVVIVLLVVSLLLVALIVFYFVPILKILRDVGDGVKYGITTKLRGVLPFSVMVAINMTLFVVGIFAAGVFARFIMRAFDVPEYLVMVVPIINVSLIELLSNAGFVLCVIVLLKFNKSLQESPPQPPVALQSPPQPYFPPLPPQ